MSGLTLSASGGDTVVSLGNGQTLVIIGVTPSALSASNFIFSAAVNTAPVATDDVNAMGEDATAGGNVLANDSDTDAGSRSDVGTGTVARNFR